MEVHSFYDTDTATFTYIINCVKTKKCAVIDPVLNFDVQTGRITHRSIELIEDYIDNHKLELVWILETHIHADHLTAGATLKNRIGGMLAIGEHITDVIEYWAPKYNFSIDDIRQDSAFDRLLVDGEQLSLGELTISIMHTPGHTPACVSYWIEDALFVGDTLFMPSLGTARCDFPGGSAEQLYSSIHKMYQLPEKTRIFTGHDYPAADRLPQCMASVRQQKAQNILLTANTNKQDYIHAREKRDSSLPVPKLLLLALQVNLTGGKLPPMESNGVHYLKIPLSGCVD